MGKGYRIIELEQIGPLMDDVYAVTIYHWLIQELYAELKERLNGIEIEVIKVMYMGAYPALGLHYHPIDQDLEDLVHSTATKILTEKPVSELVKFIGASEKDWKEVTARLMA